jgi:hypothetical protein
MYLALALVSAGACRAVAEEQKISCDKVPSVVRSAFAQTFPKATINECATELEEGKTAYEISSREGEIGRDVLFYPDGTLIVVEETIALGDAPDPVRQAVGKALPGGEVELAEKVTRGASVRYEFRLKHQGKQVEVVLDPSGNIVKN